MNKSKSIVVTGGTGRFAQSLKSTKSKYNFLYPSKSVLDITKLNSIKKYLKKKLPQFNNKLKINSALVI